MNCPNKNHPDWIKLVNALGEEAALKAFILNNEEIPNADEYLKDVNFTLKVVDKLVNLSNVRTTIRLNSKEQPYIETNLRKTLNGQGVTNQQIDLIFDYMKSNNIKEISTKDLALEMAASYSFNVEINTAKGGNKDLNVKETEFKEEKRWSIIDAYTNMPLKSFKTEEEANNYLINELQKPTSHYSNLTVPGGTNYTEQEIATPLITPSIKGHAQFATDKGIGWFRSDDKENKIVGWKEEDDFLNSETAQYNPITKDDKVIFGHPTIGKSYLKKQGNNDFITLDDDYADEVNAFIDANRGKETRQEYKGRKPKEYNQFMLNLFDRLKLQAKKEGKRLFVSNTNILKERMSDFDKVITIPKDEFKKRFDARGATYGFEDWKSDIDATVAKVDKSKVISTRGYLSDLLEGNPKTRRILEVQSDLFQKGRDKEFLVDNYKHTPGDRNFNVTYEGKEYKVGTMGGMQRVVIYKTLEGQVHYENPKQDWLTQEEIPQGLKDIVSNKFNSLKQEVLTQNKSNKENQFLQLLNKDSNWVTFFVKSIIQDSAKKGYEKVLFPSGDTASKVEGHTTLEEFRKEKEDRIKKLEAEIQELKDTNKYETEYGDVSNLADNKEGELEQLKLELERVETEGFGALKPIWNFYENTVTNILKKNYDVTKITDEHGNTWNEIFLPSIETTDILLDNLTDLSEFNAIHEFTSNKSGWEKSGEIYKLGNVNSNADVILPIGTSGSGKSTFIKSLSQKNLVIIEPDAMRVEFTGDMNDKSKDKEIYIEAANRAIQAIKQGKKVVFDTTNLTKDKRLPFIQAIKKEIPNANIQYKLMELNPELAKQRIKAQLERRENRANVSDATIDRHTESYKQMLEDIKKENISPFLDNTDKETISNNNEAYFIIADELKIASNDYIVANESRLNNYLTEAKKTNLPIYIYSQKEKAWRKFVDNQWVRVNYVTVPKNFKTNQTTNLTTVGRNAIRKVYRDTKNNEVTPITVEELPTVQTAILNESSLAPIKKGARDLYNAIEKVLTTDEFSEEITSKSLVGKESNVWEENINHYFDDLIESGIITDKQFKTLQRNTRAYDTVIELLRAKFGIKTNNLQEIEFALENIAHRNTIATKKEEIEKEEIVLEETKFTDAELEHYVNVVKRILYMITLNNTSDFNINTLRDGDGIVNVKGLVLRVLTNNYNKENKDSDQIKAFNKLIEDLEDENGKLYEYAWNAVNKDLNINKNQFEEEYQDKLISKNWDSGADNTTSHSQQISKEFKMYFNQIPIMDNSKGTIDADGNAVNPLEPHIKTLTGLPETLDYDKVAGWLHKNVNGFRNIEELKKAILRLARVNKSFHKIYTDISSDTRLAVLFASQLDTQIPLSLISLVSRNAKTGETDIKLDFENKKQNLSYYISDEWNKLITTRISSENNYYKSSEFKTNFDLHKGIIEDEFREVLDGIIDISKMSIALKNGFGTLGVDISVAAIETRLEQANRKGIYAEVLTKEFNTPFEKISEAILEGKPSTITGYLNSLAKKEDIITFGKSEITFINVNGNLRFGIMKPTYLSNWFKNAKSSEDFKNFLVGFLREDAQHFNNLLIGTNGLLLHTENGYELNQANSKNFLYSLFGGTKNVFQEVGAEYKDYNETDLANNSLYFHIKNTIRNKAVQHFITTPSDSTSTAVISFNPITVTKNDVDNLIGESIEFRNSEIFKALFNTNLIEIEKAKTAFDVLFNEDAQGNLTVKEGAQGVINLHYILENGKPVYLKNNIPTGQVFQFHNTALKGLTFKDYARKTADVEVKFDYIRKEDFINKEGNLTNLGIHLQKFTQMYAFYQLNQAKEYYKDERKTIVKYDDASSYEKALANFVLNDHVFIVDSQNLFGGNLSEYGKWINQIKRAKQIIANGQNYVTMHENDGIIAATIANIEVLSTLFPDTVIDSADGTSYLTWQGYQRKLDRTGTKYDTSLFATLQKQQEYLDRGERIPEELKLKNTKLFTPQKNYYYEYEYNEALKTHVSKQVKNAEFILYPELVEDSEISGLYKAMTNLSIDQLNTLSSEKSGTLGIVKVTDENGKLRTDAEMETELLNSTYLMKFSNMKKQLDFPAHTKDSDNKLAIQISRLMFNNLSNNLDYTFEGKKVNGDTLFAEFSSIVGNLTENAAKEVLKNLTINGKIDINKVLPYLERELKRNPSEVTANILKSLQVYNNEFLVHPSLGAYSSKIQELLYSLFTNNIVNLRTSGLHAAQMSSAFMNQITKDTVVEGSTMGGIEWLSSLKEKELKVVIEGEGDKKVLKAQILLPAWSKRFIKDGKRISIDSLSEEARTMLGYRIPTEGKYSAMVFEVVGFLPEGSEATIAIPADWIALTGSDFDIDSIYVMVRNLNEDLTVATKGKAGQENKIVSIFESILSSPYSYKEIKDTSNFASVQEAKNELEASNVKLNPNNFFDRLKITTNVMEGRDLKAISVAGDTLNSFANRVQLYVGQSMGIRVKLSNEEDITNAKELYGNDFNEKTNILTLRYLANNPKGTNVNFRGELITTLAAQLTANILDNVKYTLPHNVNLYTVGVYKNFISMGMPDYKYATAFIQQPILIELANLEASYRGGYNKSSKSHVIETKVKWQMKLADLLKKDKQITDEEYNNIVRVTDEGKKFIASQKTIRTTLKSKSVIYSYEELVATRNLKGNLSNQQKIDYYRSQLSILSQFVDYKSYLEKNLKAVAALTNFDKATIGPSVAATQTMINKIEGARFIPVYSKKNGNGNIIETTYPKFFKTNDTSIYPPLEHYFINGYVNAADTINSLFLESNSVIASFLSSFSTNETKEKAATWVRSYLLRNFHMFKYESANKLLGIQTKPDYDLDITNIENLEAFKDLAAYNQLLLVKAKLYKSNKYNEGILNNLKTRTDAKSLREVIYMEKQDSSNSFVVELETLLNEGNPFIKELIDSLVKYEYFTKGLSFNSGMIKYLPTSYYINSGINGHFKKEIANLSRGENYLKQEELKLKFYKSDIINKDSAIVPIVSSQFEKIEGTTKVDTTYPNWNPNASIITVTDSQMEKMSDAVVNAEAIKIYAYEFRGSLYQDFVVFYRSGYEKDYTIYTPIARIHGHETGEHSEVYIAEKIIDNAITPNDSSYLMANKNLIKEALGRLPENATERLNQINGGYIAFSKEENGNFFKEDGVYEHRGVGYKLHLKAILGYSENVNLDVLASELGYIGNDAVENLRNSKEESIKDFFENKQSLYIYEISEIKPETEVQPKVLHDDLTALYDSTKTSDDLVAERISALVNRIVDLENSISKTGDLDAKVALNSILAIYRNDINYDDLGNPQWDFESAFQMGNISAIFDVDTTLNVWGNKEIALALLKLDTYEKEKIAYFTEALATVEANVVKTHYKTDTTARKKLFRMLYNAMLFTQSHNNYIRSLTIQPAAEKRSMENPEALVNFLILDARKRSTAIELIEKTVERTWKLYMKEVLKDVSTNDKFEEFSDKDFTDFVEEYLHNMANENIFQHYLDAGLDTTNILIQNLWLDYKLLDEQTRQKAIKEIDEFHVIFNTFMENGGDVDSVIDRNTGKFRESVSGYDNVRFLSYLVSLHKNWGELSSGYNILQEGYLAAVPIKTLTWAQDMARGLGWYDDYNENLKASQDVFGNIVKQITLKFSQKIEPKDLIKIRKPLENETNYEEAVLVEVQIQTGRRFKTFKDILRYNEKTKVYNEKLNINHAQNISYDLKQVIPLMIKEASKYEMRINFENEMLLSLEMLSRGRVQTGTIERVKSRLTKKTVETSKEARNTEVMNKMKDQIDKSIYQEFTDAKKYGKHSRVIKSLTSFTALGLNPFSAFNNINYGLIQNVVESFGGEEYTLKDYKTGIRNYWGLGFDGMSSMFADTNQEGGKSYNRFGAIIKFFDVLLKQDEIQNIEDDAVLKSSVAALGKYFSFHNVAGLVFSAQTMGEHFMQNTVLLAMLNSNKVINGKIYNFEMFSRTKLKKPTAGMSLAAKKEMAEYNKNIIKTLKEEFLSAPSVIDFLGYDADTMLMTQETVNGIKVPSPEEFGRFRLRVLWKNKELHGIYDRESRNLLEKGVVTAHLMLFRKWFRPGFIKRFGRSFGQSNYNEFRGKTEMGTYTAAWDFLTAPIKEDYAKKRQEIGYNNEKDFAYRSQIALIGITAFGSGLWSFIQNVQVNWQLLTLTERSGVIKFIGEMTTILFAVTLKMLIAPFADDDDDEDAWIKYKIANFALYQADRLKLESLTYFPLYGWVNEGLKLMQSPAATFNTAENAIKAAVYTARFPFFDDVYTRGIYKDQYKAKIAALKLVPFVNQYRRLKYIEENNRTYKLF